MADLTLAQAAAQLGLDTSTLRHQIRNGHLRAHKFGSVWAVSQRELARYRERSLGNKGGAGQPRKKASK